MTYADLDGDGEVYSTEILEENNYYPFGLRHKGYNELATENPAGFKYKFGGKELNEELGIDVYDFAARNYDPALGRWMSVDPLAEQTMEPYSYVSNNPIMLIDPDGMSPISVFAKMAAKLGVKRAGQSFVKNQIRNKLSAYGSKAWGKQLLKDAGSFVDMTMNTSWWEYAIEVVPVVGDAYGASKLGKQGYTLWKGLERFEAIAEIGVKASKNAWKKLGDSSDAIGKGSDKLKQYINKFNNQGTHLNADDLGGAVKEKFGLSSNGQHLKEATGALEGMGGQIGRLKSDIKNGIFEGDALKSAEGVLNSVEQQYNKINRTLNSADKQVKKLGKFE